MGRRVKCIKRETEQLKGASFAELVAAWSDWSSRQDGDQGWPNVFPPLKYGTLLTTEAPRPTIRKHGRALD